ncbi:MAG: GTP cyclohydrolase I FolE [Salinibacter sp.]|uniref:GTP cyclohydrolase I FolE n=1 Tax=Salinibacter sp. TaxID=2065818 RepID=UPI0035D4BBBE
MAEKKIQSSGLRTNGAPGIPPKLYERRDIYDEDTSQALGEHIESILEILGEDPDREGLADTPRRVAQAYQFLMHGYALDPREILQQAVFEEDYDEMILVKDIEVYSLCEHHMLPFYGKAHVAYIPDGKIVGLSKIPRTVEVFARRLQVQERLTLQIRDAIDEIVDPLGTAVVIEAKHLCMMMRGAEKQNSATTTSSVSGEFDNHPTRDEFMRLIGATE